MSTLSQAQRSYDRQLPPDAKPVEFTLEDWADNDPDGFNAAIVELFDPSEREMCEFDAAFAPEHFEMH